LMVFQAPTLQVTGLNAEGSEGDDGESH
jgi:hypothetical protein